MAAPLLVDTFGWRLRAPFAATCETGDFVIIYLNAAKLVETGPALKTVENPQEVTRPAQEVVFFLRIVLAEIWIVQLISF